MNQIAFLIVAAGLAVPLAPTVAIAQGGSEAKAFSETLGPSDRRDFEKYLSAKTVHDFRLDTYWRGVTDKRALRRTKKSRSEPLTIDDYVQTFPPDYKGPVLSAALQSAWDKFRASSAPGRKATELPTIADALAHARQHYGFVPTRISEREFKRRYAREALQLGLTKSQVLRIYALETGGQGTADMQSGINPITKQGKPISSAIGYAQLLHANSVDEIGNSGDRFLARLQKMAAEPGLGAERAENLSRKVQSLRAMVKNARSVKDSWDAHVAFGNTPKGMGIHAVNLDGDIGPWLQVIKLAGLKKTAAKAGRTDLTGAEIELMNLAGPATGLEMMQPAGLKAPTTNFFARAAYGRNTVVRGRTSRELLEELDRRMDFGLKKAGAIEFAAAFDDVTAETQAAR